MEDGWIVPTKAGEEALANPLAGKRRRGRPASSTGRAAAIRRAIQQLEEVLPAGAEVLVGDMMASAQDVVDGFRSHAARLERRRVN